MTDYTRVLFRFITPLNISRANINKNIEIQPGC